MANTNESVLKQEDLLAFLKGYAPERKRMGEKDTLAGRYRILTSQPISELSSAFAKAYGVRDEMAPDASLYALIYESGTPVRQKNITALKTYRHPALVSLLAEGMIQTGSTSETRYAVVLERPAGQLLSQRLSQQNNPVPESLIMSTFLRPLVEVVSALTKLGISHNRIHPDNIYLVGSTAQLGECISEPSGFSQDYLFEPIERILTSPHAKADFSPGTDCYALAMLTLYLALGFTPFTRQDKETLVREILNVGAYHALVVQWDLPADLQDLFRGMFNDSRRERWDVQMLESWLAGRRFNLVLPSSAGETSHGFEFAGKSHFNCKSLADGMWQHWKEAYAFIADSHLTRWLKGRAHRVDTADAISRIAPAGSVLSAQQEDDALARTIILLDPTGPLRFKHISTAIDGLGTLLAHAFVTGQQGDVQVLTQIIESDLPSFWAEQQKTPSDYTAVISKLQKLRQYMRMKGLGFGIERCLYDLNPGLPCLSPMLKGYYVATLAEMLAALDAIAPQKAALEEVGDRHIAAFITSRLNLSSEITLPEVHALPALKKHPGLATLKLLTKAQNRGSDQQLKGLCYWLIVRLLPLLDGMHSHIRQSRIKAALRTAANKGSVEAVSDVLLGHESFEADLHDFQKAAAEYSALKNHVAALKSTQGLAYQATLLGRGVGQSIAYSVCLATVYITLKSYFNL